MADDILKIARERFKAAADAEDENRKKELDDLKFLAATPDDNWQWPAVILNERNKDSDSGVRPCLTINKLPQHHRQVTNEQRMNRPQIRVQPVDDKGDTEVADIYNGIIRHIQVSSEADLAFDTACDAQVASGVGYFRVLTEYCDERSFDQDIVIAPLPDRFKVYLDPVGVLQHPAGKKCKWGFVIEDLPKEDYEEEYGKDFPVDWDEAASGDMSQWFPDEKTVRVAEYFALENAKRKLYEWANGATSIEGEPLPQGVFDGEPPKRERTTTVTTCVWRKITGQRVLKTTTIPTKYIPIIRVVGNQWIIEGEAIVSGLVRPSKDAQRMYNYWTSQEATMLALAPMAPFVGYAGQFEGYEDKWKKANRVPYAYLEANPSVDEATGQVLPLPQRAIPALPQAGIMQAKLAASDDIKATMGQYNASLGLQGTATSGKQEIAQQRESDVGTFHYIDNLGRAIRYAGTIIVDMIPKIYDRKRIARIVGEDGETDHVWIDPKLGSAYEEVTDEAGKKIGKVYNLGVGKYDVVVTVGPSFTTKRQEAAEFLTNAVQAAKDPVAANVLTYLAMKSQDWAGADEGYEMLKKLLPPGIADDPEKEEQEPVVQTPEGPLPVSQASQLIGALLQKVQAQDQAMQKAGDMSMMEQDLKRQATDVAAKAESLRMREQLIAKTLEAEQAKDEAERTKIVSEMKLLVERAVASLERMKQADVQMKEGEDAGVAAQKQAEIDERNDSIEAQQAMLIASLQAVIAAIAAPRRTVLIRDENGRPQEAVSAPVMQE